MIYELNGVYYLKSGNDYEAANIEFKYNRIKKKNVLVITGSGTFESFSEDEEENMNVYSFKELEKKLCEKE